MTRDFLGRQEDLAKLKELFALVADRDSKGRSRHGPRMCVVVAHTGVGKTRLAQELYRWLASHPQWDAGDFWPDDLGEQGDSLKVNPDLPAAAGAQPAFVWWGLRAVKHDDRNASQVACIVEHSARLRHLADRIGRGLDLKGIGKELGAAVADELIPGFGAVAGVFKFGKDTLEARKRQSRSAADAEQAEQKELGEELLDDLQLLACRKRLPVVVLLDDMQWANQNSLQFVVALWNQAKSQKWPLLVLATHWETEWRRDLKRTDEERESTFSRFAGTPNVSCLELKDSPNQDLQTWLAKELPGLTPAQSALLVAKARGNFLQMVQNVKPLKHRAGTYFVDGDISKPLSPIGERLVLTYETDPAKRAQQRFEQYEEPMQRILGWASHLGMRFIRELVVELARRTDKPMPLHPEDLLQEAEDPEAILAEAEANTHISEFRQAVFHQEAQKQLRVLEGSPEMVDAALRPVLVEWVMASFDEKGEVVTTAGLRADKPPRAASLLSALEQRDLLGWTRRLLAIPSKPDWDNEETLAALRCRLLAVLNAADASAWAQIRELQVELGNVEWHAVPRRALGNRFLADLLAAASMAGALHLAEALAELLVTRYEPETSSHGPDWLLWHALEDLATIRSELGKPRMALPLFERSRRIVDELSATPPTPEDISRKVQTLTRLASIQAKEPSTAPIAIKNGEEALSIARLLPIQTSQASARDANMMALLALASIKHEIARREQGHERLKRLSESLNHQEDALALARLMPQSALTTESRMELAQTLLVAASIKNDHWAAKQQQPKSAWDTWGQEDENLKTHGQEALFLAEELVTEIGAPKCTRLVADCQETLAKLSSDAWEGGQEALHHARLAVKNRRTLLELLTSNRHRADLARSLHLQAELFSRSDQYAAAEASIDEALLILTKLHDSSEPENTPDAAQSKLMLVGTRMARDIAVQLGKPTKARAHAAALCHPAAWNEGEVDDENSFRDLLALARLDVATRHPEKQWSISRLRDRTAPLIKLANQEILASSWLQKGHHLEACLHNILEHADFSDPRSAENIHLICRVMESYGLTDPRRHLHPRPGDFHPGDVVKALVDNVLRTRIPSLGFALCELKETTLTREWPYLLPARNLNISACCRILSQSHQEHVRNFAACFEPTRTSHSRYFGFYGGLIGQHRATWTLFDWKADHLGQYASDYEPHALWQRMQESGYILQYHLGLVGLHLHLRNRLGASYDYDRDVAGACLVFLRGVGSTRTSGWLLDKPDKVIVERLAQEVFLAEPCRGGR